jgi:hypothetical protein
MSKTRAITAGSVGAVVLFVGFSAPAAAGPAPWGAFLFPHYGVAGALANAVIGLATLPLTIAAAAAGAGQPGYTSGSYAPPAYYPRPANYYGAPAYYAYTGRSRGAPYARSYGGYPRYNAGFGYHAAPHAGHYYHRW